MADRILNLEREESKEPQDQDRPQLSVIDKIVALLQKTEHKMLEIKDKLEPKIAEINKNNKLITKMALDASPAEISALQTNVERAEQDISLI